MLSESYVQKTIVYRLVRFSPHITDDARTHFKFTVKQYSLGLPIRQKTLLQPPLPLPIHTHTHRDYPHPCKRTDAPDYVPSRNTFTCKKFFQNTNLVHNSFNLQKYICYTTLLNMFRAAQ